MEERKEKMISRFYKHPRLLNAFGRSARENYLRKKKRRGMECFYLPQDAQKLRRIITDRGLPGIAAAIVVVGVLIVPHRPQPKTRTCTGWNRRSSAAFFFQYRLCDTLQSLVCTDHLHISAVQVAGF